MDLHLRQAKNNKDSYLFSNFEVEAYATNETASNNPSTVSRIRNLITKAFCIYNKLPRLIVIILEDSIVQALGIEDYGATQGYKEIILWLIREYKRSILEIQEKLPQKSIKQGWPHVLFIAPSVHKNYPNDVYRRKFTMALENSLRESKHSDNMSSLRIQRPWDHEDGNYTWRFNKQMSDTGISKYWEALDRAIKCCITKISDAATKGDGKIERDSDNSYGNNYYRRRHFDNVRRESSNIPRNDRYHFTRRN